jgi:hypothetical protein
MFKFWIRIIFESEEEKILLRYPYCSFISDSFFFANFFLSFTEWLIKVDEDLTVLSLQMKNHKTL